MNSHYQNIMNKVLTGSISGIVMVILIFLGFLYGAFTTGFVGMMMWKWFVVQSLSVPAISWPASFGIALLLRMWIIPRIVTHKDEKTHHILMLLFPWIVLFCGWLTKSLFM